MIETLISSKTRIKLLLKFFLNSNATAYLRSLETEFGESSNGIRIELNKFEQAGMLSSYLIGNKKIFKANTQHPLFQEIHNIVLKQIGLDSIIENVIKRLGDVDRVYLIGEFSKGVNSEIIDLMLIGNIETNYLHDLIAKVEKLIKRKVRYIIYSELEVSKINWQQFDPEPLLLWAKESNN